MSFFGVFYQIFNRLFDCNFCVFVRKTSLQIRNVRFSYRRIRRKFNRTSLDKRARSHDYLVVISRHIPRIRHDVAVDRRRCLYAANELYKFVFGVEFYASYNIVAFHAGIRQRFVAQIVVNLPKQYASFYGVFNGNRRHKKPLIKRQITAEITSDFVSYRRRRETIRNLADNFGFSRKICACGRDSAACVFD